MSVERVRRMDGRTVYRVRWREGGRNRSRVYSTKRDAQLADAEMVRRRRLGTLAQLDAGTETLDEFVTSVWGPVHAAQLAPKTRTTYATVYAKHVGPYLGGLELRAVTAEVIAGWQAERLRAGAGPESIRKARSLLGGICNAPSSTAASPRTQPAKSVGPAARHARRCDRSLQPLWSACGPP